MADDDKKNRQQAKMFFDKGYTAFERGNLDIAIDLLRRCVTLQPDFFRARKFLRAAQVKRFQLAKKSSMGSQLADVLAMPKLLKAKMLTSSKKYTEAMNVCEDLLSVNPFNVQFQEAFLAAAEGAGDQDSVLITLEAAYEARPNDIELTLRMGQVYMDAGIYGRARDCFSRASEARPGDLSVAKLLKDADARNTMDAGGWEEIAGKQGGYRDLIRDKEQAKKLDQKNKAVNTDADSDDMVNDLRAKIAREPKNLNFYRGLARVLQQGRRFDEALQVLKDAQVINPADPELEAVFAQVKSASYDALIEEARAAGEEEKVTTLQQERDQFVFDNLLARVERYPNNLDLRFELGKQYFKYQAWDEAVSQFQMAQKSPKVRVEALYYLAVCFKEKGQKDMAVMQLETANDQLPLMDNDLKKRVVYTLGMLAEEAGDLEKAFAYYKDVYAADIGFADIGERMERLYKQRKG